MNRVLDKLIKAGLIAEYRVGGIHPADEELIYYSQRTDNYCFVIMQNSDTQTILRIFDPALQLLDECQLPLIPHQLKRRRKSQRGFNRFTEKTQQMKRSSRSRKS
jgi:hypothetical protein